MSKVIYRLSCRHPLCTTGISNKGVRLYTGPYAGHNSLCWYKKVLRSDWTLTDGLYSPATHPPPRDDIPLWEGARRRGKLCYGFSSLDHLINWFSLDFIREAKYLYVHTYEVPEKYILAGRLQVAFYFEGVAKHLDTVDVLV